MQESSKFLNGSYLSFFWKHRFYCVCWAPGMIKWFTNEVICIAHGSISLMRTKTRQINRMFMLRNVFVFSTITKLFMIRNQKIHFRQINFGFGFLFSLVEILWNEINIWSICLRIQRDITRGRNYARALNKLFNLCIFEYQTNVEATEADDNKSHENANCSCRALAWFNFSTCCV